MLRTVSIVPSLLTNNKQDFRIIAEKVNTFTRRVQVVVSDGEFAPANTLDVTNIWWPKNWETDLYLMATHPSAHLSTILKLSPSLCILHAEASENLLSTFQALHDANIKTGLALLPGTYPGSVEQYIEAVDHVMLFAGQLDNPDADADMMQAEKIAIVRNMKPEVEIGWYGGANLSNVRSLAHSDLDVINVGSTITQSEDAATTFQTLVAEIDKGGVVI